MLHPMHLHFLYWPFLHLVVVLFVAAVRTIVRLFEMGYSKVRAKRIWKNKKNLKILNSSVIFPLVLFWKMLQREDNNKNIIT